MLYYKISDESWRVINLSGLAVVKIIPVKPNIGKGLNHAFVENTSTYIRKLCVSREFCTTNRLRAYFAPFLNGKICFLVYIAQEPANDPLSRDLNLAKIIIYLNLFTWVFCAVEPWQKN